MAITPDTIIKLLKVPIEIDNNNQLTFSSSTAQYNYFNSLPQIEEEELYYQRKDGYILFPEHIDNILEYNYVMYQNSNYSNKWFYAFITDMIYENDGMTRVYIDTDVYQTWMFDITFKASFIEREHVNDDTIGKHTIPENLNVGEVIEEQETVDSSYQKTYGFYVAISSAYEIADNSSSGGEQQAGISVYNGTVFGEKIYLFKITQDSDYANIALFLLRTNSDSHIADVKDMFIVPSALITQSSLTSHSATVEGVSFSWYSLPYSSTPKTFNSTITKRTSFTGISIKNNKCFVYPYNYILVSNNNGNMNIYKYEDFSTNNCVFENQLSIGIGCSGRLVPKNYKGMNENIDESLPLGKYPTCGWSSDAFINWLTQNSVNMAINLGITAGGIALGAATFGATTAATLAAGNTVSQATQLGFVGNTALGVSESIGNTIGSFHEASLLPNIQGSQPTGDVVWATDTNYFSIKEMRAKNEYIKVIDNYFTMYGYKVNDVKIPNITGRAYWNYVKTINANIEGDIPQKDLQLIKDIFNKGVTLWHDPTKFLDYTQNNTIIT